ncbi:hypothetical protein WMY93_008551 [Mugilogobius chulae]|uniref:Uncharacterized protein n=1 Tax=Mugilogobius chulae TaxID=88201 RepID=A0AAW0PHG2_9GOBI
MRMRMRMRRRRRRRGGGGGGVSQVQAGVAHALGADGSPKGIQILAEAGDIQAVCRNELRLESRDGEISLDAHRIRLMRLPEERPRAAPRRPEPDRPCTKSASAQRTPLSVPGRSGIHLPDQLQRLPLGLQKKKTNWKTGAS